MKIDKKIFLPDVLDKTVSVKRLTAEKKEFSVPSVLDSVKVLKKIKFSSDTGSDGTNQHTKVQEANIVNSFYCTNPEEEIGAEVWHQGNVYLHRVEEYQTLSECTISNWDYTELPIIKVRDLNNPSRKVLNCYKRSSGEKELIEGWENTREDYNHDKYYPRTGTSILRKPKYKYNLLRTLVLGCNPSRRNSKAQQFLVHTQRKQALEFLRTYWVSNRNIYDVYCEGFKTFGDRIHKLDTHRWTVPPLPLQEFGFCVKNTGGKRKFLLFTHTYTTANGTQTTEKYIANTKKLRSGAVVYNLEHIK